MGFVLWCMMQDTQLSQTIVLHTVHKISLQKTGTVPHKTPKQTAYICLYKGSYQTKLMKDPNVSVCTTGTYHMLVTKVISLNIFQTEWF